MTYHPGPIPQEERHLEITIIISPKKRGKKDP
jgi:hypothetical protein